MNKTTTFTTGLMAVLLCSATSLASADTPESGVKVEMKYDVTARENGTPKPFASTCPVRLVLAEDARQNKETIGQSMSGALLADHVGRWVTDGLVQLKDYGYTVSETGSAMAPGDGVTIKTSVTRAYTWQIGLKIFSMVALKAEFLDRNGGVLQQKYYRSHGDKTNMWGANSEHVTTLNYGLNNMLPAIAADLQSLCNGQKVEPYTYAGPEVAPKK